MRSAAQSHKQSAVLDKVLNLGEAFPSNAASDVVRFRGRAEARRLRRLFEGHRAPGFGQTLNLFGKFEIHVAVEQNVHMIAQGSGADIFIAKISVGNLALIERVAKPADCVGVGPWHPHPNARRFFGVSGNVRHGGDAGEVETQFSCGGFERHR